MDRLIERLEARTHLSTVTWDGEGGDFSWHNPLNWSGDVVPTLADDVVIDGPLAQPIVHFDPGAVSLMRSLTLGAPLAISGGTFRVEEFAFFHAPMSLSGGMLSGTADITVFDAFEWTGGSIRGFGSMLVTSGGTMQVAGDVILARTVFVESVMSWDSGDLIMVGGKVSTLAGGLFEANSTGRVRPGALINSLKNDGTLRRTEPGRGIINVTLDNTGMLEVLEGALSLWGPVVQFAGGTITGGMWRVGERAVLATTSGPLTIIGPDATVRLESQYRFGFPALAGLQLNEGTLQVVGRRHLNFLAPGFVNGETGTIEKFGAGTHTIATQAMVNYGTIVVHSGILRFAGGADLRGDLDIRQGSEVQITSATTLQDVSIFGPGQLRIMHDALWASGTIAGGGKGVIIGEPGKLIVQAGPGTGTLERQLINYGTVLWGPGMFTWVARVDNYGQMRLSGVGHITRVVNHGDLTLASPGVLELVWLISDDRVEVSGGEVRVVGWGTLGGVLDIESSAELRIVGALEALTVTGEGTLRLPGSHIRNITFESGTVVISGSLYARDALRLGAASLVNNGTFWFATAVTMELLGGPASIENNGIWYCGDVDLRDPDLQFSNTGTLHLGHLKLLRDSVVQLQGNELAGGNWRVFGELDIEGAAVHVNRAEIFLAAGAAFPALAGLTSNYGTLRLEGSGPALVLTPQTGTLTNHGTLFISAGRSVTVNGDLVLDQTSFLQIEIYGTAHFGLLNVSGSTALGGEVQGWFVPQTTWGYWGPGEQFNFLTTTQLTGNFATVSEYGLAGFIGFSPSPTGGLLYIYI